MAATIKSSSKNIYLQQVLQNDMGDELSSGITIDGVFIQTSFGYQDGTSADLLASLQGDVAVTTDETQPCNDAVYCLNSRTAVSGCPGLTTTNTNGCIVIAYPNGYLCLDQCFTYYWYSQVQVNLQK
ncbi:MAG: hypothetical protein HRU38_04535 [Saccharospirillaceae bacterium]|nr:hypothetical protein [Pseudomonadales bacterium]NRB77926.1 hypothetical protein [Saccharospirillaceae bacterium]